MYAITPAPVDLLRPRQSRYPVASLKRRESIMVPHAEGTRAQLDSAIQAHRRRYPSKRFSVRIDHKAGGHHVIRVA